MTLAMRIVLSALWSTQISGTSLTEKTYLFLFFHLSYSSFYRFPYFHRPDLKGAPRLVGAEYEKNIQRISENDLSKDSFHNNSIQ